MKKARMIFISIFVVLCMVSFLDSAYAGKQKYICYVDQVGCQGKNTRIMLSDEGGQFTQKWFKCDPDRAKEMLAIILTALYGNMQVEIKMDPDKSGVQEITHLYIVAP